MNISRLDQLSGGPTSPQIIFKIAEGIDSGETVPLEISGGVPPYRFSLSGPATLDLDNNQLITIPSDTPTSATLTITDNIGQTVTQTIPIRTAQIKYKAVEIPDPNFTFSTKDLSFTTSGNILMASNSTSYGSWRVDKIPAAMNAAPTFLDFYFPETDYPHRATQVLAVDENTIFAAGFSENWDLSTLPMTVTIRRSLDGGKNWTTVFKRSTDEIPVSLVSTANGYIFALISSQYTEQTFLVKSTDGGNTWNDVYTSATEAAEVLHVAEDKATLYLGYYYNGDAYIKKSINYGLSWSAPVLAGPGYITDITTKGSVLCWTGYNSDGTNLYGNSHCSQDQGGTWAGESYLPLKYTRALSVKIANSGSIFVTGRKNATLNYLLNEYYMRKSNDNGVTWSTVTLPNGFQPEKIEQDSNGHLYLIGVRGPSKVGILKSTDNGINWTEWQHDFSVPKRSFGLAITTSSSGTIFTTGSLNSQYVIRKSTDNGGTWTDHNTGGAADQYMEIKAIGNNVFAIGNASGSWRVWKTSDDGANWSLSDQYDCPSGVAYARGIAGNDAGPLFVVGSCMVSGEGFGIIRRSNDNGRTWQPVDTPSYQWKTNKTTEWRAVTVLPSGEVIVLGTAKDVDDKTYWIARRSLDQGQTWTNIDTSLEYAEDHIWGYLRIVSDANRVLLGGRALVGGVPQLILRQSLDKGSTWTNLIIKNEDTNYYTPDLSGLYLDENGVYLAYYAQSKLDGAYKMTIEKSRNFNDWFKIGELSRSVITGFSKCGASICASGRTNSMFGPDIWADFKIE